MNKLHSISQSRIHAGVHNSVSRYVYNELTAKIERMFRVLDIYLVKMSLFGVTVPPLLNSAANYYVYDLKDESFLMPRPMMCVGNYLEFQWKKYRPDRYLTLMSFFSFLKRLPFDWKTPSGYLVAWIFQFVGYFCTIFYGPAFIGLYLGSCWLFVAFAKDLANDLRQSNGNKISRREYRELKAKFCRTVHLYAKLKQLRGIRFGGINVHCSMNILKSVLFSCS